MLRVLMLILLLASASAPARAAEGEAEFFQQAARAFNDQFYPRAEQQFAEFAAKYPESTNAVSATLLQAQARFFQKRYEAALDLLKQHLAKAGPQEDEFIFWIAESLRESGSYAAAAENYRALLKQHPASKLALRAAYLEAFCAFQLKDFARAADLLRNPDADFQKLARVTPAAPAALRGALLLGDALLALGKSDDARAVLSAAAIPAEIPELDWEKNQLLARLALAGPAPESALTNLSLAISAARKAKRPLFEAQSRNLEADVYRKAGRVAEAVAAYEKAGAIEGLPVDQKRLAVLKTVELLSTTGLRTNALTRLESYLTIQTNEPAADLLHLKAGELWLEEFRARPSLTNALLQARTHLNSVLSYTNSPHLGRAWLNLGWCDWEEGTALGRPARLQASEVFFRNAAQKLTRSDDQAIAFFKIADAQFAQGRFASARSNYLAVVRNYTDLPQVKNAVLDKAYAQLVRVSTELKDFDAARTFLAEFRAAFPNNALTEETLYRFGEALAEAGQAGAARQSFHDFLQNYPGSALAPEVRFAEARTYALEGNLETALKKHEEWLRTFTNSLLRGEVEFRRAALVDRAGQRTNAFKLFTNFVAAFPKHVLAPAAQSWVGDYYYEQEQWPLAEQSYQRLFQNTNWLSSPLAYEARLMAAKTAFKRQGYNDARGYLTNLINTLNIDPKAPAQLVPEAYFVLGDVFLEEPITGSTNNLQNFLEAAKVFDFIASQYPSNRLGVLALGKKGDCHLQIASSPNYVESYAAATNSYLKVLNSTVPDVPISARNQAEVGLGVALKNLAETKPPSEREALQRAALNRFLDVVYARRGPPDPYYLKLAGLEAGRMAEVLGESKAALDLYKRLLTEAPALRSLWEAKISSLQQRLAAVTAN